MNISILSDAECKAALGRIVSEFGDGHIKEGQYVFDVITRLPAGFAEKRLTINELISSLKSQTMLLVIFDPHSANNASRLHLLHSLGIDEDVPGVKVARENLARFFADNDCDFYVTAIDGALLAAASHEDEFRGKDRVVWCPVAPSG